MESIRQQKFNAAEDFDPSMDWVKEPLADTLRVYIPGFRKEQLKVQVTSTRHLRISGERRLGDSNRITRFHKEIPIASNYDPNAISAKLDKGILLITHPKIIAPVPEPRVNQQPPKETAKPPRPQQPAAVEPRKPQEKQSRPHIEAPKPPQSAAEVRKSQEKQQQSPTEASKPPKPATEARKPQEKQALKPSQPAVDAQKPQEKERQPAGEAPKSQEKPSQLAAEAPKVQEPPIAPMQPLKPVESPPPVKPEEEKKKEKQENESYNRNAGSSFSGKLAASGSKYKKVLSDAVMEMKNKNPRDLINRVMVILIVIIAIYAMKLAVHKFDRKLEN